MNIDCLQEMKRLQVLFFLKIGNKKVQDQMDQLVLFTCLIDFLILLTSTDLYKVPNGYNVLFFRIANIPVIHCLSIKV